ncbi:hypothetical protein HOLleu_39207 [Holothuria leucospilota]|uniref:NACHT domain-containing protein n=1 Tax=Holothuria leucospilota TaxID=206669 RepID=A0A9Q0YFV4_HOLLE|nr:hypothetical protein HOLleu_39207 [Holothuria leucospilota]
MTKYKIVTYVKPVPGYPVVEECNYQRNCTLEVQRKGNLTCVMRGVLPKVKLEWKTSKENLTTDITFHDKTYTVIKSGETFNIKLTSSYSVAPATHRVSVECGVSGPGCDIFPIKSVVDLLFYPAEQEDDSVVPNTHHRVWIWMFVPITLLSLGVLTYRLVKKRFRKHRKASLEEGNVLMQQNPSYTSPDEDITVKHQMFINQLRQNYKDFYTASPPPPFMPGVSHRINTVYVDGCMEVATSTCHKNDHLTRKVCRHSEANNSYSESEKMDSYVEIVNERQFKSALVILEGKPGVGKSFVACQIVYDWLKREQDSNSKHNEILIFLPLRRLGGIKYFYQAVQKVALSHDFPITESEIEAILGRSPSVTVILDGYDEYPNKDKDEENIVYEVIELETLKNAQVILTTRTPFFPRRCARQIRQIKMSGFDNKAQDEYIRKAVSRKDLDADSIKRFFNENSILNELGRIPLVFVKFAHMYHEPKQSQKLFAVTNFFRHVMSCFNCHMINKTSQEEEDNEKHFQVNFLETEHEELNKVAFEALTYRNQQTKWEKEKLLEELTPDFYDQCVRTGILIEETISSVTNIPSCGQTDRLSDATMVKFYHKIFCEWFAAHHLANHIAILSSEPRNSGLGMSYCYEDLEKNVNDNFCSDPVQLFLEKVDPFELQYVYRFACGLNRDSAENIIKCLNRKRQTKSFAILCTLEKEGDVKSIAESLRNLFSTDVFIRKTDSQLQQRTIIQLLEIASKSMVVPIVKVWLANSFRAVDVSNRVFHLQSNLRLPVLRTLKELEICENGRELTEKEFGDILKNLSSCPMLEEVVFNRCLLPQSIKPDSLCLLQSNQIQVFWAPSIKFYRLNLVSGQWEILDRHGGIISRQITNEQYQELEEKVRSYSRLNKAANSLRKN